MRVLLTGGAGYIGSHVAVDLISAGHEVVIFDNFSTSRVDVIERISIITGLPATFVHGDVEDSKCLRMVLQENKVDSVIHLAGLKSVGESSHRPMDYYSSNVAGSLSLIKTMHECNVKKLVFSSSATVYGSPRWLPLTESHPTSATSAYGRTKLIVEEILRDVALAHPEWRIAVLRYFNPVGAHPSGLIGDDPNKHPNNLMPYICQVAAGQLEELLIFGNDYDTPDGTGVRDYIHVTDLVKGHLSALSVLGSTPDPLSIWNLGTGKGYSVRDVIEMFELVNGVRIPFRIVARRPGDVSATYASPARANADLGWAATLGLEDMCLSSWKFQRSRAASAGTCL